MRKITPCPDGTGRKNTAETGLADVDLVKDPAIAEMHGLRLAPAAQVLNIEQLHLRILGGVLGGHRRVDRAEVVFGNDGLCLWV